ncbi:MAG: FKBP-type peptidyl-prolyl cis-trans isomerase [Bacteroidia bacterium]|nr:FKBP-type peptidyl-prolyl cis-trans isomerase [Bacteroidia bacterium]
MRMKYLSLFVATILLFSCSAKSNQSEIDDQLIKNYLVSKQLTATKDASGLYYITTAVGTGAAPTATSSVEIKYKGSLINGTVFDQTATDKTATFALSGLITGWMIGIPLMKVGGKATFFIPSGLGYGSSGQGSIPPNTVLIFDIELISVK